MRLLAATLFALLTLSPIWVHANPHEQTLPTRGESPIPDDLLRMAKDFNAAMRARDLDKTHSFYSERYLHDGRTWEKHRGYLEMVMLNGTSQFELKFTRFAAIDDDRAYIEALIELGYYTGSKEFNYQVVKENGQWKWMGNQKP